jgi:class 3 adenylate cyclase
MAKEPFSSWLTARTWRQGVRYSRVVACLLPAAALAVDWPYLVSDTSAWPPGVVALMVWQLSAEAFFLAILAADRWWYAGRGSEAAVYAACAGAMGLATWIGVADGLRVGDLAIYTAGATFVAAVMCTPRPVRRPLYVLSLAVLAWPAWVRSADVAAFVAAMVNPFCVVVLCIELDRVTLARQLALYLETQRAEAERQRADQVLYNVLPARVADELKRAARVQAVKYDNLGVLFADLVGFTAYARRLPPDALVLVLDEIFCEFDALVERHGVEKIKTIGDGYMATAAQGPQALCMLAVDMRRALHRYNRRSGTQFQMRVGIHAGPAVGGVLGRSRLLYDVWGETVNLASRLQASAGTNAIHVSHEVVLQASAFAFQARPAVRLKGQGRLATYWLLGPQDAAPSCMSAPHEAALLG